MKKQPLIHIHGLLDEVRKRYEAWQEDINLEYYEGLGIESTNIHKSKVDHEAAVMALAEGITGEEPEHELKPYDEDELYEVLEENSEPGQMLTDEGTVSRPKVKLTSSVARAVNEVIGNWNLKDELSRLEQQDMIESHDNGYEVGTNLYLTSL